MYMRYTQGQNEEYLLSCRCVHVLNQVLTKQNSAPTAIIREGCFVHIILVFLNKF